uniref:Uncharacterized protein n=1 Tax=Panagrellus redivivus TaxID=6233 RepID=A0A7E4VMG1_PANRE
MRRPPPATWLAVVVVALVIWAPSTVTAGKQIPAVSAEPEVPRLKFLELFHAGTENCVINRWSYYNDKYYKLGKVEIASELNVTTTNVGTCDRNDQVVLFEVNRFYIIQRNPNAANRNNAPYKISTYKVYFDGKAPQEIAPSSPTVGTTFQNLKAPPGNCMIDVGNLLCVAEHGPDGARERVVFRFIRQSSAFSFVGFIRIDPRLTSLPERIIYDPHRRDILEIRPPSSDVSGDFKWRSVLDFHTNGGAARAPFDPHNLLASISKGGEGVHIVINAEDQSKYTLFKYNPYAHSWSNDVISTHDWEDLPEGNQMGVLYNYAYSNTENDASILMEIATKRCENMQKKVNRCQAELSSANSVSTALYVVVGILMFFFIVLAVLLALYLLCCIKTKRRRRRKKKRKHRRHRKVQSNKPEDGPKKGGSEEDVEMDPNAKKGEEGKEGEKKEGDEKGEEEKEKKEDNKVVKKLKAFGGVDYSSSSSDDDKEQSKVEHSQAYFSARDQFDGQGNAVSPAGGTTGGNSNPPPPPPPGGDNNYENLGPLPGAPPDADTNTDGHGGVPEQELAAVPGGAPRSVYMKPAKKKKK